MSLVTHLFIGPGTGRGAKIRRYLKRGKTILEGNIWEEKCCRYFESANHFFLLSELRERKQTGIENSSSPSSSSSSYLPCYRAITTTCAFAFATAPSHSCTPVAIAAGNNKKPRLKNSFWENFSPEDKMSRDRWSLQGKLNKSKSDRKKSWKWRPQQIFCSYPFGPYWWPLRQVRQNNEHYVFLYFTHFFFAFFTVPPAIS